VTSKTDHRIGLTPVFKRLSFHLMLKGAGTYPSPLPNYDTVIVRSLYDFTTPSDENIPSQGAVVVEWYKNGRRERWCEFGCRVVGGGGAPIMHEV